MKSLITSTTDMETRSDMSESKTLHDGSTGSYVSTSSKPSLRAKRASLVVGCALLAGLFVGAAPANKSAGGGGGMSAGPGGDNDNIGSLPLAGSLYVGQSEGTTSTGELLTTPVLGLVLEGPTSAVQAAVAEVSGVGLMQWALTNDGQTMHLVFSGEVSLVLDAELIAESGIQVEAQLGEEFLGGLGAVAYQAPGGAPRFSEPFALTNPQVNGTQSLGVPVKKYLAQGLLETGQTSLHLWSQQWWGKVELQSAGAGMIQCILTTY